MTGPSAPNGAHTCCRPVGGAHPGPGPPRRPLHAISGRISRLEAISRECDLGNPCRTALGVHGRLPAGPRGARGARLWRLAARLAGVEFTGGRPRGYARRRSKLSSSTSPSKGSILFVARLCERPAVDHERTIVPQFSSCGSSAGEGQMGLHACTNGPERTSSSVRGERSSRMGVASHVLAERARPAVKPLG